jgi:hypothetical protein
VRELMFETSFEMCLKRWVDGQIDEKIRGMR